MQLLNPVDALIEWAQRAPDAAAMVTREGEVSYAAFLARIQCYAYRIAQQGDHPKVMIVLPQGVEAYAVMFATLMAGGCYVPVGQEAPAQRRAQIAAQFEPDLTIQSDGAEVLDDYPVLTPSQLGEEKLETTRPLGELAYVIFTSGSTGIPKGVMISPQSLFHYLGWSVGALGMGPGDRCSQHPNIGFDLSVLDIYTTLCSGAALVPLIAAEYRYFPARAVQHFGITIWISVPSVVDLLDRSGELNREMLGTVKRIFFCGEPLLRRHLERLFTALPGLQVINAYGPTEATVSCTALYLDRGNFESHCLDQRVAIGDPIDDMVLEIEGEREEGELVIAGPQVARGYWHNSERTAAQFDFCDGEGRDRYRTGDWVQRHQGALFFIQRLDRQIKVDGYRVELGDIDAALHSLIACPVCTVFAAGRIVSFVEQKEGVDPIPKAQLIAEMSHLLPRYAVPKRVVYLDCLPRNQNDKIDLSALEKRVTGSLQDGE